MPKQPVPHVTSEDVERIIRRDFPPSQFDAVIAVLKDYGLQRERSRVELAALKLENGDLAALRKHINTAIQDFRDVVAPAEYPEYSRKVAGRVRKPPVEEEQGIIDSDRKQYEDWLRR